MDFGIVWESVGDPRRGGIVAMSRRTPPDHRDPNAFAGLTVRRRRLGLATGPVRAPRKEAKRCSPSA